MKIYRSKVKACIWSKKTICLKCYGSCNDLYLVHPYKNVGRINCIDYIIHLHLLLNKLGSTDKRRQSFGKNILYTIHYLYLSIYMMFLDQLNNLDGPLLSKWSLGNIIGNGGNYLKYHFVKAVALEFLFISRLDFVSCFLHRWKSIKCFIEKKILDVDLHWKYKAFFPFDSLLLKHFSCEIHNTLLLVEHNDPSPKKNKRKAKFG